jgi:CheY-like chemotaxis protein
MPSCVRRTRASRRIRASTSSNENARMRCMRARECASAGRLSIASHSASCARRPSGGLCDVKEVSYFYGRMAASALRRSDRPRAAVLLVEDDEVVRDVLAAAFERAGWNVEQTTSCEGMARALRRKTIDVIVVDRHLPDGDGWTAASEVRRRSPMPDLVVIAMTSHLALSNAERALVAGCEAFLEKPCDPDAVVATAGQLLGSRAPHTKTRRKRPRDS